MVCQKKLCLLYVQLDLPYECLNFLKEPFVAQALYQFDLQDFPIQIAREIQNMKFN